MLAKVCLKRFRFVLYAALFFLITLHITDRTNSRLIATICIWFALPLALIAFALFRMLSRNFYARQQELARYMNMERSVRNWWQTLRIRRQNFVNVQKEKKKYKYLTCPQGMQKLRVPKGKGRIRVTCSKCGNRFEAKS